MQTPSKRKIWSFRSGPGNLILLLPLRIILRLIQQSLIYLRLVLLIKHAHRVRRYRRLQYRHLIWHWSLRDFVILRALDQTWIFDKLVIRNVSSKLPHIRHQLRLMHLFRLRWMLQDRLVLLSRWWILICQLNCCLCWIQVDQTPLIYYTPPFSHSRFRFLAIWSVLWLWSCERLKKSFRRFVPSHNLNF